MYSRHTIKNESDQKRSPRRKKKLKSDSRNERIGELTVTPPSQISIRTHLEEFPFDVKSQLPVAENARGEAQMIPKYYESV